MIAEAVVRIGQQLSQEQRIIWYQSVFSQLVAYHSWLYKERDPNRDGLVVQLHPWETGLDNSPPCMVELRNKNLPWWLRFLEISHLDNIGNYFRTDYNYVSKGERSSNIEALSLYNLLTKIRRKKYDSQAILRDPAFAIEDITYNSILIRANALLSEIAEVIHQKLPEQLIKSISQAASALENLWDNDNHQYFSRQFISGRLIKQPSIGSLLALYSGAISHQRAGQLVKIIEDNQSYGLEFPLPTVPTISSWFNPNQYWQGPTWVNTNWLIIDGLKRYGFHDQANSLTMTTLCLVEKSGFYEYFNPISGVARGVNNFSWTAALTIDLIQNTGLVG
jgi:hypothetical protein